MTLRAAQNPVTFHTKSKNTAPAYSLAPGALRTCQSFSITMFHVFQWISHLFCFDLSRGEVFHTVHEAVLGQFIVGTKKLLELKDKTGF